MDKDLENFVNAIINICRRAECKHEVLDILKWFVQSTWDMEELCMKIDKERECNK